MFGREEKLKRVKAEVELAEALGKIQQLTKEIHWRVANYDTVVPQFQKSNNALMEEVAKLKGKLRAQTEADLVFSSLQVLKLILQGEKKMFSADLVSVVSRQQAAEQQMNQLGGFQGLGAAMDLFMRGKI